MGDLDRIPADGTVPRLLDEPKPILGTPIHRHRSLITRPAAVARVESTAQLVFRSMEGVATVPPMPVVSRRILISAFDCSPGRGSDPGTGWGFAQAMAKHHEVWVLTSGANRPQIDVELNRDPCSGLNVVYCDLPSWIARRTQGQHMRWSVYYYPWQVLAYFVARHLHHRVGFHLIHHVTLMKFWMPTFLFLLPAPLIWGPVGGGESAPRPYHRSLGVRGRLYEAARDGIRAIGARDPFVRLSARRSVLAYGSTEETSTRLRALGARRVRTLPGVCLPRGEIEDLGSRPLSPDGPLRVISIARLLHWKGFQYGLAGFAAAGVPDAEYWIVGDGPERASLERLATRLGIARQVRFLGALGRDETMKALGECHALVHPSLHDSGGSVCLEAMAAGRPVIYLNTGGPAALVGEDAGIRITASSPADSVRGLAGAIRLLAAEPEVRSRMGTAGRRHMANRDWDSRAEQFTHVYEEVWATWVPVSGRRRSSAAARASAGPAPTPPTGQAPTVSPAAYEQLLDRGADDTERGVRLPEMTS